MQALVVPPNGRQGPARVQPEAVGGLAVRRPGAGLDLGHTSHREIAVAVLAELVQLRAAGALHVEAATPAAAEAPTAVDPVCGMTVPADETSRPFAHGGVTYYFCSAGCRTTFERDPAAHLPREAHC